MAVKGDGTVFGLWAPPAGLSNVVEVASGVAQFVARRKDGTVVAWPQTSISQAPATLTNVIDVASGSMTSVAVVGDGTPVITASPHDQAGTAGQ